MKRGRGKRQQLNTKLKKIPAQEASANEKTEMGKGKATIQGILIPVPYMNEIFSEGLL